MAERALFIPTPLTLSEMHSVPYDYLDDPKERAYRDRIEAAEAAGAARVQRLGEGPEVLEPGLTRDRREWAELGYGD